MSSSSSPHGVMSISVCGCMLDIMEVYCSFNGMKADSSVPGCLGVMTELMYCALSEYDTVAKTSVMSALPYPRAFSRLRNARSAVV